MTTPEHKWRISLFSACIFLAVVHPATYNFMNSLLENTLGKIADNGCPTTLGLAVHTLVFTLVVRYSMDVDIV
jgi:hypothetical protein